LTIKEHAVQGPGKSWKMHYKCSWKVMENLLRCSAQSLTGRMAATYTYCAVSLLTDGIVKHMKSKAGPSSKNLLSVADAEKFLGSSEHSIIGSLNTVTFHFYFLLLPHYY